MGGMLHLVQQVPSRPGPYFIICFSVTKFFVHFSFLSYTSCCQVGYFPADCVEMIGEKVPQSVATKIAESPKPGKKFISLFPLMLSVCVVTDS